MTHDRLSTLQVICTESWGFTMEGTEMNQNSHFCKHSIQKAHQALINTLPDTQQDTLITQAVCSRVSGPEQQALMRASDFFFFFFDISFLQASLLLSETERFPCLICIHDGNRWVPRECRATFALRLLGRSAAEPFRSSSRAWRSPGRLTRFRGVSFPVLTVKRKCWWPN